VDAIGKGRFAVIDMRNDGKISYVIHLFTIHTTNKGTTSCPYLVG
jgi:hypothetical protein